MQDLTSFLCSIPKEVMKESFVHFICIIVKTIFFKEKAKIDIDDSLRFPNIPKKWKAFTELLAKAGKTIALLGTLDEAGCLF